MATLNPQPLDTAFLQQQQPQQLSQPMAQTSFMGDQNRGVYTPTGDASQIVSGHLDNILNQNNALMRNARISGLEAAASRGLQNSSIAAGAAQRAALDYAMPLVGHAQDTFNQREHRGWQTGERLGSQDWQSGERALDRTHDFTMQDNRQSWQSGESALDRDWRTGERLGQQEWQSGESALDRDWRTDERLGQQAWQSGESAIDRDWRTDERLGTQDWQSGEAAVDRDWRSNEALRDRDWRSLEAQLDRSFTAEEREAVQAWQSGESALSREQQVIMANLQEEMNRAQREWSAEQSQLDRDQQLTMAEVQNWLSNEAFMRDFNAQLATMPINNTANLLNFIAQQAITNPEIYTPDIVSGMSEFFATNSMDVLSRYFPNYFQNTGGA